MLSGFFFIFLKPDRGSVYISYHFRKDTGRYGQLFPKSKDRWDLRYPYGIGKELPFRVRRLRHYRQQETPDFREFPVRSYDEAFGFAMHQPHYFESPYATELVQHIGKQIERFFFIFV